jgi:hypothetical protein
VHCSAKSSHGREICCKQAGALKTAAKILLTALAQTGVKGKQQALAGNMQARQQHQQQKQ